MNNRIATVTLALAICAAAHAASPYAGQESREIKALSADEVSGLLSGKGMGFAKAAELNGFAGPAHVLELASELQLTVEQRARTEVLFASMSAKAAANGRMLVEREKELDRLFSSRAITREQLAVSVREIGELQAAVRNAHLEAHLLQVEILTTAQNARYSELRDYGVAHQRGGTEHKH